MGRLALSNAWTAMLTQASALLVFIGGFILAVSQKKDVPEERKNMKDVAMMIMYLSLGPMLMSVFTSGCAWLCEAPDHAKKAAKTAFGFQATAFFGLLSTVSYLFESPAWGLATIIFGGIVGVPTFFWSIQALVELKIQISRQKLTDSNSLSSLFSLKNLEFSRKFQNFRAFSAFFDLKIWNFEEHQRPPNRRAGNNARRRRANNNARNI
ncbi:hypothetical protein B9Z55_011598 [Caenorhabditis nigoni]|uniref:Uncharacterized protein n=1 Tax=Caenorhabditis nigoni TaxID=1611254 RepID=A0A2G5ULD9_9PELO|nr:hypothetical protein B9Z55_011598 [Caenorhabditis nigoni]